MAADALEKEMQAAERAKQIRDDPMVAAWFAGVSEQLLDGINRAKDEKEAFRAAVAMQVFGMLRRGLISYIESGKLASLQLEREKKRFGLF